MGKPSQKNAQAQLEAMKASYREAKKVGDREEESRWANQIGNVYKDKGEYVEALKWFRLDYDIASGRKVSGSISPAALMPTCQCMGEIHYRMQNYKEALLFQEKHYQLAREAGDLLEQQRASTQLARTYLDIYEGPDEDRGFSDVLLVQKCLEYMTVSMDLAKSLADRPPSRNSPSFVKELIDAYNNMGMMKMVFEDFKQAEKYFLHGLKICNDEELPENDDSRSRLHHNLGRVYLEKREWQNAKEHMNLDVKICNVIGHAQGEAKGLINLGELSFKRHHFADAIQLYKRAVHIAESLEDEDVLVSETKKNIEVVREAQRKMDELTSGLQTLMKLQRAVGKSRNKMNLLKQEHKLLRDLLEQAEDLHYWVKYLELSKEQKRVSKQLGDSGKLGDAYASIGLGHYHLRAFEKAKKWHRKSFDVSKMTKHLEGQAIAKINFGNALDANGEWEAAIEAFEQAYELASSEGKTKMLSQQIIALENMQYAYTVRFEQFDKAREIECRVKNLKSFKEAQGGDAEEAYCSETDSEQIDLDAAGCVSPVTSVGTAKGTSPLKVQSSVCKKRPRIVLSDDEEEEVQSVSCSLEATPRSSEVIRRPYAEPLRPCSEKSNSGIADSFMSRTPSRNASKQDEPIKPNESSISSANNREGDGAGCSMDIDVDSYAPGSGAIAIPVIINGQAIHVYLKDSQSVTAGWFLEELARQYRDLRPQGPQPILSRVMVRGTPLPSGNIYNELVEVGNPDDIAVTIAGWRFF